MIHTQPLLPTIAIAQRFYPDVLPPYLYEPTRDCFRIDRISDSTGEGVRSLIGFQAGEIVFRFTGFLTSEITQFSLQLIPGTHIHDPYFMGKVLHNCDPNTDVDIQRREFIARRDIAPGELITMDYAQTEDVLFRTFVCSCGAPNCRGIVKGRLE
ncbi:MAG: SET domain-containing protein-lysine N-methyltransferase [Anaerolineae bacterium]|nr:SET domain-containing protein-lysine N-methyltransferase [Anaerolineae bacterium]